MKAVDIIKLSLEQSESWILGMVEDMKDAPLTAPTPNGGNHPLWVLGHLTYSEADLAGAFITGQPNPLAEWKEIFGQGSQPTSDASKYPTMDQLLEKFKETRAATMKLLDGMSDEDLDKPSKAPEEMREFFGTIAACLTTISLHFTFHGGQIADARRAAGRAPLMG